MQTVGIARGHSKTGTIIQNGIQVQLLNDLAKLIIELIAQLSIAPL